MHWLQYVRNFLLNISILVWTLSSIIFLDLKKAHYQVIYFFNKL
jgi:hypothetical protein